MNEHVRRLIAETAAKHPDLGGEELARKCCEEFGIEKGGRMIGGMRQAVAEFIAEQAAKSEGGPRRLKARNDGETIEMKADPGDAAYFRPVGASTRREYVAGFDRGAGPDRSVMVRRGPDGYEPMNPIREFIERRAEEVEGCPPEKPEVTLRQLIRELEESKLL